MTTRQINNADSVESRRSSGGYRIRLLVYVDDRTIKMVLHEPEQSMAWAQLCLFVGHLCVCHHLLFSFALVFSLLWLLFVCDCDQTCVCVHEFYFSSFLSHFVPLSHFVLFCLSSFLSLFHFVIWSLLKWN